MTAAGDVEPEAETPSRWGRYGGRPLFVLCLVGLVDAVDRGVVPAVLPKIQRDLHVSDSEAGLLYTTLIVATVLIAVPAGVLSDRKDRRVLITGVLAVWSVTTALAAGVQRFWQLLVLRSFLGAGDAVNDPAVQSLVADYYPGEVRGRAYAFQRIAPTAGLAVGTALGAGIAALFGWRVAVLAIALPGITVALLVRKLPLPPRGASDEVLEARESMGGWAAVRETLAVPSVRYLLVAAAVINGILSAIGFWALSYHVRSSGLSEAASGGIVGGLVLLGAIGGGIGGGLLTDRYRGRVSGWPMVLAGLVTGAGAILMEITFFDGIPVYTVRLPLQVLGIALIVAALPPVTVVAAEVVPPHLRGTSFGLLKLFANVLGAIAPWVIGAIADTHRFLDHEGERVGDLGYAFRWVTPLVVLGSVLLLLGRRRYDADHARANAAA
jgi:MFS family permease